MHRQKSIPPCERDGLSRSRDGRSRRATYHESANIEQVLDSVRPMIHLFARKIIARPVRGAMSRPELGDAISYCNLAVLDAIKTYKPGKAKLTTHIYRALQLKSYQFVRREDLRLIHIPAESRFAQEQAGFPVVATSLSEPDDPREKHTPYYTARIRALADRDNTEQIPDRLALQEILRLMSDRDRFILLSVADGYSHRHIGKSLGISGQRVEQLYRAAIRRAQAYASCKESPC